MVLWSQWPLQLPTLLMPSCQRPPSLENPDWRTNKIALQWGVASQYIVTRMRTQIIFHARFSKQVFQMLLASASLRYRPASSTSANHRQIELNNPFTISSTSPGVVPFSWRSAIKAATLCWRNETSTRAANALILNSGYSPSLTNMRAVQIGCW